MHLRMVIGKLLGIGNSEKRSGKEDKEEPADTMFVESVEAASIDTFL